MSNVYETVDDLTCERSFIKSKLKKPVKPFEFQIVDWASYDIYPDESDSDSDSDSDSGSDEEENGRPK